MIKNRNLTEADLDLIEKRLNKAFVTKDKLEAVLDLRFDEQGEKIEQKLYQFRSDIFDKIDPILKEIQDNREERTITVHRVSDHEDRIEVIEKQLNISSTS